MTVSRDGRVVRLQGACRVEEAEALADLLQTGGIEAVDVAGCTQLHGAVFQVLVAFGVAVRGEAEDPFLREIVFPALQAGTRDKPPPGG